MATAPGFQKAVTPVTEGFYKSPEFASFGYKDRLLPASTNQVDSPYFGASIRSAASSAAMDKAYEAFKARTTGGVTPVLTAEIAKDLLYRSMTTGVPTVELNLYGGAGAVKSVAAAAGLDRTPADIQKYEIENNLPESAATKLNKQFIGPEGAVLLDQLETDLNSSDAATAKLARDKLTAQQKAAEQEVVAERTAAVQAEREAAVIADTDANGNKFSTYGFGLGDIGDNPTTGGGLLSVPTGTTAATTTGTGTTTGARTGAVTLPTEAELRTMSQGGTAAATTTPKPLTNEAVRQAYLSVLGREPDAAGLKYFSDRFGTDVDASELGIFRTMAAPELAAKAAATTGTTAGTTTGTTATTGTGTTGTTTAGTGGTTTGMSITQAYQQVLGRTPNAQEIAYWTTQFGADVDPTELSNFNTAAQPEISRRTTTGTTTGTGAGTTAAGMSIISAYQQVLGRTPNAQEIAYWTTQFGADVDAKELSSFSVAAQPELAARPTTNNAVRQMYLSVLGREPDATGLKYFSDRFGADVDATELGIFRGMSTQELAANAARNAGTTAGTTAGAITRPTTPAQVTSSQLAPATMGKGYSNIYQPANYQQNAPTLASIQAAAQSANPYQSLMALSPQRTLSPSYAAQAGQTAANTNLGGYDTSLYSKPLTGLLAPSVVAGGGGGTDFVNNSGDARGPGTNNTASNIDPFAVGMARVANLFTSPISLTTAPVTTGVFNPVGTSNAGGDYGGIGGVTGGSDTMGFGGEYAKGGMVNMRPQRNNPPGPDDGYAALDNGEYVIRKSAVKKYGANIFEKINAGQIPARRLKSLLE